MKNEIWKCKVAPTAGNNCCRHKSNLHRPPFDLWNHINVWPGGCGLRLKGRGFDPRPFLRQVVHTRVPLFTKQYKLVLAKGQRRPAAGRVTAGLDESCRSNVR